jgi:hypothetical protein
MKFLERMNENLEATILVGEGANEAKLVGNTPIKDFLS